MRVKAYSIEEEEEEEEEVFQGRLLIACSFMPPIGIGYWLGLRSRSLIKPAVFKRLVIGFSLLCGIVVLSHSTLLLSWPLG